MALVEEVVAVPELDTVSQVITAPARLESVMASPTTAMKEQIGKSYSKRDETLKRKRHPDM